MSFIVCHMQKFKSTDVRGIEIHNKRQQESKTNPDIEKNKSVNNFEYTKNNQTYGQVIKDRLKSLELKKAVRKDAVVLCQFVITSDSNFFANKTKEAIGQFFQDSMRFLNQKYGRENFVNVSIHLDEKTPHMHIGFIPVTQDNRLSAKSIFTRSHLKNLQTEIFEEVGKKWGLERGIEGSDAEHIISQKFKKNQLENDIKNLEIKNKQLENEFKNLVEEYQNLAEEHQKLCEIYQSVLEATDNLSTHNSVVLKSAKVHAAAFSASEKLDEKNKKIFEDNFNFEIKRSLQLEKKYRERDGLSL